jgi:hypothetical protein
MEILGAVIIFYFLISNVNIIKKAQRGATLIHRIYKGNPYGIYLVL